MSAASSQSEELWPLPRQTSEKTRTFGSTSVRYLLFAVNNTIAVSAKLEARVSAKVSYTTRGQAAIFTIFRIARLAQISLTRA